jgi:hypothetical protein
MEMYGYEFISENELKHHGILGQKWGKRNGPPYPLSASDHSAREKKAGWRKSLDLASNTENVEKTRAAYLERANKAGEQAADLRQNGFESKTMERLYGRSAKWNNAMFYATYGLTKNQALRKATAEFEREERKYTNKAAHAGEHNLESLLGCSSEEAAKYKKIAKALGISLATTAGVLAVGYLMSQNDEVQPNDLLFDINADNTHKPYSIGDSLLNNRRNGNYIGGTAERHGYGAITAQSLRDAINNPLTGESYKTDLNELIQNVRVNQVDFTATRRLSCWSASHSYFMSALTGKEFASKSFTNLVDFNDFGKLYSTPPDIFDLSGKTASNFVGRFGKKFERVDEKGTKQLIESIAKNIGKSNNLSPDGTRTLGFIDAGYHSMTCTHQWNFELQYNADKSRSFIISDGYSGERYHVADIASDGSTRYTGLGLDKFTAEMRHYNRDSVRFYAPSLDSINADTLSQVIIGKT